MTLFLGDKLIAGGLNEELTINNPFSLLDYKYSEYELDNASWLLSNGQYNSGAVYTAVYDLLLAIYNGTETKTGVSVKLSTETYGDTDFVLNTDDTSFRLPTKVLMAGSKRVAGNGKGIGLTDGTQYCGIKYSTTQYYSAYAPSANGYGKDVGDACTAGAGSMDQLKVLGVTTDETKSGIETSANGLYLYFYVGETVQDANIIAAASVLTRIAELSDSYISGLGMPSDRYDELTIGAHGSIYTAPANGWFALMGATAASANSTCQMDTSEGLRAKLMGDGHTAMGCGTFIPIKANSTMELGYYNFTVSSLKFIYAEGEN